MDAIPSTTDIILTAEVRKLGGDLHALRRAFERRELVRLRRGAYCTHERWESWTDRDRHFARVLAASRQSVERFVVAGVSAAAVWGMPLRDPFPHEVTVLDVHRGGGRSEPGVRRVTVGADSARVATIDGLIVTDLARTALDVARTAPFRDAVGSVDWAMWRKNSRAVTRDDLRAELRRFSPRVGARHLRAVVEFATDLSDSFGESMGRAGIHEAGFAPPVLQFEIRDAEGLILADYAWPDARVLGEFDGESKFTDPRFNGGNPMERLREQRRREARLRRLGWTIVRIEWPDVIDLSRLAGLLSGAGVPRRG
jgi:predicted transcriptional regulator of viral defense system